MKKPKPQGPIDPTEGKYNKKPTTGHMVMTQAISIHQRNAQEQFLGTTRVLCAATQWGDHETIRHVYGRKDKREAG